MRAQEEVEVEEQWRSIPEFPLYEVSNMGNILNVKTNRLMRTSVTPFGHVKITLTNDWNGHRYTRSVANIVAEAFIDKPTILCDEVIVLNGDLGDVRADNLEWRPRWYQWKYTHQLKMAQPLHYRNLPVINRSTGDKYSCIVVAGMEEGLLFEDIWRSTYTGLRIFPYNHVFEVVEFRV